MRPEIPPVRCPGSAVCYMCREAAEVQNDDIKVILLSAVLWSN